MKPSSTPTAASPAPTSPPRWRKRFFESAAGTWCAAVLFVAVPFVAANIFAKLVMSDASLLNQRNLIKTLVLLAGYWAYVHWWERRPVEELSLRRAVPELGAGVLLGGLLFAAVVGLLAAFGAYSLEAVGTLADLGAAAANMLPKMITGALIEEVLFRLLLLRLLERSFGTAWALALSSLAFGLAHLGNVGSTPLISVMLGLELGLLCGAAYLLTRRLWLCAAVHLGWNFAQGAIFSIPVSGQAGDAWLRGSLNGPAWLTGGAFGAEGSVVSLVLCLALSALLLMLAHRRRR